MKKVKASLRCSCACQAAGKVAAECAPGIYGTPTDDGWVFAPLACALDAGRLLLAGPRHAPVEPEGYKRRRFCSEGCGRLISDRSRGRCRVCQQGVNARKGKGGPRNPKWGWPPKKSMNASREG